MRTILHSDINSCYASIECMLHPEYRSLPLAVGGDEQLRHGIILAKNEHAKAYGIKTGEALWQARQKCPGLKIVKPNFEAYTKYCGMVRELYADYTDMQEAFGLDESWLDVTGCITGDGEHIAQELRRRIKREIGITVSVGVSWNKVFAKLGSDYRKPDAVTTITRENYRELVWPLPAENLLYIGPATKKKLAHYGILTIGQLAAADRDFLHSVLGKAGWTLHAYANGQDASPVLRAGEANPVKSIGNSTTTPRDMLCPADARVVLSMLCEGVGMRLRESGMMGCCVAVSMRDTQLVSFERQCMLERPTMISREIFSAAERLVCENYSWERPLRSIGVRVTELVAQADGVQLDMFTDNRARERRISLDLTTDRLRNKYGYHCLHRGLSVLDPSLGSINPLSHSFGG